ncbi:MAG: hypothetical protein WCS01_06825 [bacterium]
MKQYLQKLIDQKNLGEREMGEAFDLIMTGVATPAQLGAFLTALRLKGETVEEIAGACGSMRRHAVFVDPRGKQVVDTCGTGGDSLGTFNISTTAAFVVAGAGVPVDGQPPSHNTVINNAQRMVLLRRQNSITT